MNFSEWFYLPVAALINSLFVIFWQKKKNRAFPNMSVIGIIFMGSLFNAWGLDAIQRLTDISTLFHVMKVSLGCWLFILIGASAKHYAMNGWSKKIFWTDSLVDLISFFVMGGVIFALT